MNLDGRSTALLAELWRAGWLVRVDHDTGGIMTRPGQSWFAFAVQGSRERIATGATPESALERLATLISHDTHNSPRIIIATATDTDASCARTPKGT